MSEIPVLACRQLVRTFADGRLRVEVLKGVGLEIARASEWRSLAVPAPVRVLCCTA